MSRRQRGVTNSLKRRLALMCAVPGLVLLLGLEQATAAVVLDWTFDEGDLSVNHWRDGTATMNYFDTTATVGATTFGNTSDPNVADMPDGQGNFLHHDPFVSDGGDQGKGGYTIDYTGLKKNGGGKKNVNEYTMIFDIYIPDLTGWTAFFNTNPDHKNNAEFFVNKNGQLN